VGANRLLGVGRTGSDGILTADAAGRQRKAPGRRGARPDHHERGLRVTELSPDLRARAS